MTGKMTFDDLIEDVLHGETVVANEVVQDMQGQADPEIYDQWLNAQFEKYGLFYCVNCGKFTDSMDCVREKHELAQSVEEMVEKQVMNRLKGG